MRIVLLGDSHLARIRRELCLIGPDLANVAVGGSRAVDLLPQALGLPVSDLDLAVVSIGSNDSAPWKAVTLRQFAYELEQFLASVNPAGLAYVVPPGVDESRLTGVGDRTNKVMAEYAAVAVQRFTKVGAQLIDAPELLAGLGTGAFTDDGVHLARVSYDLLIPAIRQAVEQLTG